MLHMFADASGDLARLMFNLSILAVGAWLLWHLFRAR